MDINRLKELVNDGLKINDIAEALNSNRTAVRRFMKKHDIKSRYYEKKRHIINCLNCSNSFEYTTCENRKFCSHSCSAIFNNTIRTLKKEVKEYVEKNCLSCNDSFIIRKTSDLDQIYCSRKCYEIDRKCKRNILVESGKSSSRVVKLYLIEKHGNKCMECGWCKTNPITNNVPIELEHIDGDSGNNNLDNLKLLCPNCHSLTLTYKALNIGNGRFKRRDRYKLKKSF